MLWPYLGNSASRCAGGQAGENIGLFEQPIDCSLLIRSLISAIEIYS